MPKITHFCTVILYLTDSCDMLSKTSEPTLKDHWILGVGGGANIGGPGLMNLPNRILLCLCSYNRLNSSWLIIMHDSTVLPSWEKVSITLKRNEVCTWGNAWDCRFSYHCNQIIIYASIFLLLILKYWDFPLLTTNKNDSFCSPNRNRMIYINVYIYLSLHAITVIIKIIW